VKKYHVRKYRVTICVFVFLLATGVFAPPLFAANDGFPLEFNQLLPIHIAAMSVSGASILTGGIIARYRKGKSKNWLKQHKTFQWSGAVLGLLGIVTAIIMVEVSTQRHVAVAHSIAATATFGAIILTIIVAYGFLRLKKNKKQLLLLHRWFGRVTITAWLAVIILGLFTPLAGIF
jgi:hypothetical protein